MNMKNRKARSILISLLVIVFIFSQVGQTFAAKPAVETRKIVVFGDRTINNAKRDLLLVRAGVKKVKDLPLINAAVVLTGPAGEKALRQQPGVLRVDEDVIVYSQGKPAPAPPAVPPAEQLPWGVNRIDADQVWDRDQNLDIDEGANTGAGIKVAVLDTGIDLDHPDLQANIKGGINTINPRKSADDDNGHGSHVAGIIAAADNGKGVLGVAPQASLYAVKVLNSQGSGYLSDIIEGLQWSINNHMQVINMSLGTTSDVQSFHDAIITAYNSGIVLVAAAGNSGPGNNTVNYPAKYAEVIAVSATDTVNALANFSSRGQEVELAAPGVSIPSTYKGGGYATISGTSMASPHGAATAALVIASGITDSNGNGRISDEVRERLQNTADDLGLPGRDSLYGYGLLDAEESATGVQTAP